VPVEIEKIPGGFRLDGLELRGGKCGCTSVAKCCYSWSKVKRRGPDLVDLVAKMETPDTADNFTWSYTVRKDGVTVRVSVADARDKEIYSGYIPPSVKEWEARGWEVLERSGDREDGVVWRCSMCRRLYKEDKEGTPFEELPGDWKCPRCNASKSVFERIG
jgi:rubredoxin